MVRRGLPEATLFDPPEDPDPPHVRLLVIHERLCDEYGCPISYFHTLDPLSELISSFINHRTTNAAAGKAFRRLREALPTWEDVVKAPTAVVEELLRGVRWPEAKAPRVQEILRRIHAETGGWSLDFLTSKSPEDARAWLERLPGVGPKTSAATISFSRLRMKALPVDSHHHRVAQRLGLIGPHVTVGPAHKILEAMLPPEWTAQQVYDHHEVLMFHGQRVCHWRLPACDKCVLRDLCPSAGTTGG